MTVGVGRQHHALRLIAQPGEEVLGLMAIADQMLHFTLQGDDVELELTAPVIEAVPVERAGLADDARLEIGLQRLVEAVQLAIAPGQVFEPEVAVEVKVKQSAVHVQQHGVDSVPVKHRILSARGKFGLIV